LTNCAPYLRLTPSGAIRSETSTMQACKHPRVRIVSRDEDSEFVECLECGEVFDSSEFSDMEIEERSGLDAEGATPEA
jgi:hypothetical protein